LDLIKNLRRWGMNKRQIIIGMFVSLALGIIFQRSGLRLTIDEIVMGPFGLGLAIGIGFQIIKFGLQEENPIIICGTLGTLVGFVFAAAMNSIIWFYVGALVGSSVGVVRTIINRNEVKVVENDR
jgi:hypothetical protein